MKEIKAPASLSEEQIRLAKAYVTERHQAGISVADFCSKQGISSATWYSEQYMKNPVFESYLTALGGSIISNDEREAYAIVKKKIMNEATKANAGVKEFQIFLNTFSYIVEEERQERIRELGIVPEHEKQQQKTIEEKKAILLKRLTTK